MHISNNKPSHVFIFGSRDGHKSTLLNLNQEHSFINEAISSREIKFLRVTIVYMGEEHLIL